MLAQLSTLKLRLAIPEADTTQDALLTAALAAVSARFDKETNRTLARTADFTQEFDAGDTEVLASCYPIESVSKFEFKRTEAEGWQEIQPTPDFLVRSSCIISLPTPLNLHLAPCTLQLLRATYTGGYVLPGTDPEPGQTPLPADLEQAAIEQVAYWFQTRDTLGMKTVWPRDGAYKQFIQLPLLLTVTSTLQSHTRFCL